jgi:hypothetical protein
MRDIDLATDDADAAYTSQEGAGLIGADTTLVDPAFTDTKAYGRPSLGGDFGPGRGAILGAETDGGAADLAVDTTVTVETLTIPTPTNPMAVSLGRSWNATTKLNLYPWRRTPKDGLSSNNNPDTPPAPSPPPPPPMHGISMPTLQLVGNQGTVQFSGPAQVDATVTLHYSIDGGPTQTLNIDITAGDTATQIAAKVRNFVDPVFGIDASGTGGTVNVVGLGGNLTAFNVTIEDSP